MPNFRTRHLIREIYIEFCRRENYKTSIQLLVKVGRNGSLHVTPCLRLLPIYVINVRNGLVKYRLFLPDCNETRIFRTDFRKILRNQIWRKSVQWERVVLLRTDRHEASSHNFANAPQRLSLLVLVLAIRVANTVPLCFWKVTSRSGGKHNPRTYWAAIEVMLTDWWGNIRNAEMHVPSEMWWYCCVCAYHISLITVSLVCGSSYDLRHCGDRREWINVTWVDKCPPKC
jgi:hypothetical protein